MNVAIRRRRVVARRVSALPDITPIVNVALVLLIVFMVVTPMIREGITVETPKAEHSEESAEGADKDVVLSLKADGALYVNLKRVSWNTLARELALAYRGKEGRPIVVKGERSLEYEEVTRLMEACRDVGAPGVDLVAEKEK